jgi:prepilin-type N-terminal cleavage/methylation domain-containing protein
MENKKLKKGFTPLEKAVDFVQRLSSYKADGALRHQSAQTVRELRSLTGFTLLELSIVVVIIGILASIGIPTYLKTVEKGRSAEARQILGLIRMSENVYYFEWDGYVNDYRALSIFDVPSSSCDPKHYFWYEFIPAGDGYTVTAHRCWRNNGGGKQPDSVYEYDISIDQDGAITGTPGFL